MEDLVELRTLLAATLEEDGHDVIEAGEFSSAAAVLSAPEACDAVVADVRLPDGSGIALAALARKAGIPVLLCTGEPDAMRTLDELGMPHLHKPFTLDALINWISEVAGYAATRRDARPQRGERTVAQHRPFAVS